MFEIISVHHLKPKHRHLIAYDIVDVANSAAKKFPDRRKMLPIISGINSGGIDFVNKITPKDTLSVHESWLGVEIDTTQKIPRPHGFVNVKPLKVTAYGLDKDTSPEIIEGVSIDVATMFYDDIDSYARLYSQGLVVARKLHPKSKVIATEPMDRSSCIGTDVPDNQSLGLIAASSVLPDLVSMGPIHRSDMSMFRKSVFGAIQTKN